LNAQPIVFRGGHSTYTAIDALPFARGGESVCYRARSESDEVVCAKLFLSEPFASGHNASEEFRAELLARESLRHPNILPVLDSGVASLGDSARHFVVLPLCKSDLRALLRQQHFMPPIEALQILRQVAAAVDYAHGRGILHGDVKPENVLFAARDSSVFLADFGTARFFGFREAITAVNTARGSTAYLSPEQLTDHAQTSRSDIYSLAVVAYELFAGDLPFNPRDPPYRQMQSKVMGELRSPITLNPLITERVAASILTGLEKDPAARPATATEYCEDIARAVEGRSVSTPAKREGRAHSSGAESDRVEPPKEDIASYQGLILYVLRRPLLLFTALAVLIALFAFDYWQTPPGSMVTLFGVKLFIKPPVPG
jgi:serine/threonine-protein kinase